MSRLVLSDHSASEKKTFCQWQVSEIGQGLELVHKFQVQHVSWHGKGDYFTSLCPTGNTQVQAAWHAKSDGVSRICVQHQLLRDSSLLLRLILKH